MGTKPLEKLYTLREAESVTGRRVGTWREDIRKGRIKAVRVGKGVRITEAALRKFLTAGTKKA